MIRRLAYVEDFDADFALFARVFAPAAELRRWETAEAALDAFRHGDPPLSSFDVLVVDQHLPGIDGIELIALVRALPGGEATPICMLSTSSDPGDVERAEAAGADAYLVKPPDLAGLRALPRQLERLAAAR